MAVQFPLIFGTASRTPFPTLSELERRESRLFGQLASGNRLTSAAIDPAALSVAVELTTQVNGLAQAQNNIGDAPNLLNTAESAVGSQEAVLQQERQLTIQAGNGALTSSDLQIIQGQITQLDAGLNQVGQQTQFNGVALLNGANPSLTFQTGANAGQTTQAALPTSTTQQLGTKSIDVTTFAGEQTAIGQLDQAIATTSANRGSIGATQNALQAQSNNAAAAEENQLAARSRIADTNVASASSDLLNALTLTRFSVFALQQQSQAFLLQSALLPA